MTNKYQGIILNSMDYKENHKILYILTEDAKISVLVPRAKRFKEGLINETQNLTLVSFETTDNNNLAKAKGFEAIDYFNEIKNDLKKYSVASFALEVIYRMVNPDINPNMLYKLFLEFLNQLKNRNDLKMILLQFRIKMLYFLGIQPNFKECIVCRSKDNLVGLSLKFGSMECVNHSSNDNIGMDATNIIKILYLDKTFSIKIDDEDAIDYISKIIDEYYELHQYYGIKAKRMLEELKCF